MEWAQDFYAAHSRWLDGYYLGPMAAKHRRHAEILRHFSPVGGARVLKIGGGGGQSATACADVGYRVTTIEVLPPLVEHAKRLAHQGVNRSVRVCEGDVYDIELNEEFDIVCSWDGFGIGSDSDQVALLKRVHHWLVPSGFALIEVLSPSYQARHRGERIEVVPGVVTRELGFDHITSRTIDTWTHCDTDREPIVQSLRCYSPADFRLLVQGTGFTLVDCFDADLHSICDERVVERHSAPDVTWMARLTRE